MFYPITRAAAPSCAECGWLDQCGGLPGDGFERGCFDRCTSWCAHHGCDMACPTNAMAFADKVSEVEGLDTLPRGRVLTPNAFPLPIFVPQIDHGGSRTTLLDEKVVSIPLHRIITQDRLKRARMLYNTPEEVRRNFKLSQRTQFIITSVCPDRWIESFWEVHRSRHLLDSIAALRPLAMTVPNFSFMLDVPRTNNLYNFGRMFRLSERMTSAGIPTVFHLNALTQFDWNRWRDVLKEQPESKLVSLEFQTGAEHKHFGDEYFAHLVSLQDVLGRALHPLMLAGAGKLRELDGCFDSFTVIDANPFIKTMNRQVLRKWGAKWKWRPEPTLPGTSLSPRLVQNIAAQRARYNERLGLAAEGGGRQRLLLPAAA